MRSCLTVTDNGICCDAGRSEAEMLSSAIWRSCQWFVPFCDMKVAFLCFSALVRCSVTFSTDSEQYSLCEYSYAKNILLCFIFYVIKFLVI